MLRENFASIGLEIFDDTTMMDPSGVSAPMKRFAEDAGAELSPTIVFFGSGGDEILRVVGYRSPERFKAILGYVTGRHYQNESPNNYIVRRSEDTSKERPGAALKEDPLFGEPPYALDRSRFAASRPLLVIFENTGCKECADFHAKVLAQTEVRHLLQRFEIMRLDAADHETPVPAPDGRRVIPASWYRQAGLTHAPALMLFDEEGNEVLKTDALVMGQRMTVSLLYVLEHAYEKDRSFQRFARPKAIERHQRRQG
ncbi:MAG: hypothetical protein GWO02_13035 [Gammaproteobacteria bacterium]|nr:hypothetical protein [Gammaproteobacteria bacterium]